MATLKYPFVQYKSASFTSTATPAAISFDAPLQSVNSHIICVMGTPTTSRTISSISDDAGGSYFHLQSVGGTNRAINSFIAKNMEGTNPLISFTLSASCTGDIAIFEVVDLSPGTTLATTLDPNDSGTQFTTSATQLANQYAGTNFKNVRTPDQLQFVIMATSSTAATPAAGWNMVQSGYVLVFWKFFGAPGAIPTFQTLSTSSSTAYYNTEVMLSMMHNNMNNYAFASSGDGMSVSRD